MDVINCITAKDLNRIQNEYRSSTYREQLKEINKKLEDFVKKDFENKSIKIDNLYPEVKQQLESLGYTITYYPEKDNEKAYFEINWKEKE